MLRLCGVLAELVQGRAVLAWVGPDLRSGLGTAGRVFLLRVAYYGIHFCNMCGCDNIKFCEVRLPMNSECLGDVFFPE